MHEGTLEPQDRDVFKTAFAGENSTEAFTLYIGVNEQPSYLNIERNLGENSTYVLVCEERNLSDLL